MGKWIMAELVSVSEAANLLNVSVDSIRRWEKKGLIKGGRDKNNNRQFNLKEIQRLQRKLSGENSENHYRVLVSEPTKLTSVDLFAGAGGTALGLANAGFQHILVNEFDKHAAATLRLNRPEWNVIHGDIHELDFTKFNGKVDLVEGGFPCQAFSYAGHRRGFADTRGTLFHEFARCVQEIKPKVAMGENVRGLLTHDNGRTFKVMVETLQNIGYRVAFRLMKSQYFDVPQKRERLILIAVRDDLNLNILFPQEKDYTISLRDALEGCPVSDGAKYADWKRDVMKLVPEGGYWRDLPDEIQRSYMKASYFHTGGKTGMARRLAWDEPSLTLTCNPAQKQTERCHPSETRPLTVREYARIQTFPDSWEFQGGVTNQYKQIGNAVPCNLAYHLGIGIKAMLNGNVPEGYEVEEDLGRMA
ncbi:DNA (cytosine-5-)-methyltransferase [Corynebacterium belfantii]|uniref:Cytosine-specific methyltransferase n=1 Tax=Corynebacterium belfantii TaxID=2014537 RepID=A0ABS0L8X9_9CORY|nr:DNA (cytosine-5-)-methyltransferase [Corynebacterium belfantii]MBG9299427.1 DNA (cytosine-5-)-methyltransferase [Corynebacterium belfantii]MBG9307703.1 DNA (cytosine-5-)-methyltransferase [Corynebacterium belfantii]MBG9345851.1 DNA (cytosine-5-)-methyltransferase [Corynebacterium belfantii]MBG9353153.1 DNA (cytosine-5-)-methyltransferase [Corynebacterium belfantii]